MSLIGKLLLGVFEKRFTLKSRDINSFLPRMAAIASLLIFSAQLILLLLISLAWLSYSALIDHGYSSGQAWMIIVTGILVLLFLTVIMIKRAIGFVHDRINHILHKKPSVPNMVNSITDSFMEGLFYSKRK